MSMVWTNALIRLSTTSSTAAVVIGTTTTGGTPEGTGLTDISSYVARCSLTREFDEHDDTVMGLTAHSRTPGLGSWGVELEMLQGWETGGGLVNVDRFLNDIIAARAKVWAAVRTCNTARTSDNPEYYGMVRLFTHTPYDGSIGDLLKTNPAFRSAGSLARAVCATA